MLADCTAPGVCEDRTPNPRKGCPLGGSDPQGVTFADRFGSDRAIAAVDALRRGPGCGRGEMIDVPVIPCHERHTVRLGGSCGVGTAPAER